MYDLFMVIPFDLLPIMLILCFHAKNLMAYKKELGESDSDEGFATSNHSSISPTSESANSMLNRKSVQTEGDN